MDEKTDVKDMKIKDLPLGAAILMLAFLIGSIMLGVIHWGLDPQIPLVFSAIFCTVVAIINGSKWTDLENSIMGALGKVNQAMLVLLVIGMMLGTWLHSGVVPTMIYYGSKLISPKIFLPTACLLCSIASLATGDSWGTAGTVGIAIMGIGIGFGVPAPIVAGAVVSGSYFGDKMSPLSDTTLLAAAVNDVDVFDHIKYMLYNTIPALGISVIAYLFIGLKYSNNVNVEQLDEMLTALKNTVNINPILLIAPAFVIIMIIKKVDPLPALMGGTLIGSAFAMIFQKATLREVFEVMHYGMELDSGNKMVDELISGGGLDYVMWTVSLVYCAMAVGGILEGSGCLHAIVRRIMRRVKTTGGLIAATIVTSTFLNFTAADQYLAIIFPSNMYGPEYDKMGLQRKVLSRSCEDAGTITSALIPWNTCGAFLMGALGVSPFVYAPFAIFNWLDPVIGIIYGYTDFKIAKVEDVKGNEPEPEQDEDKAEVI